MKKYIINFIFLILPFLILGQTVNEQFAGFGNISSVTSLGSSNYTVVLTGFTGSPRFEVNGTWAGSDIAVNDVIFRDGARYVITLINSSNAGGFNVRVNSPDEGLGVSALNNGDIVAVGREAKGLFPMPRQGDNAGSGIPPSLASSIEIHNMKVTGNLGTDYITTDSFTTFTNGATFASIPINKTVWSTTRGAKFEKTNNTTMTRRSFENGQLASTTISVSGNTLLFNANLNNKAQLLLPTNGTTATISAPTNINAQAAGEIFVIGIQNNNDSTVTINWNSIFGKWDMTNVVTNVSAGTLIYYSWMTITDGAEGIVLSSMNDLGGGGIDSTTYSNDSAFIWNDGTDYFTGITDVPRINNGRIWYVSKSNPNCSASATVGDHTRPFCHVWQTRDSAISGDIVYVYPARYFISDTGGGGDVIATGSNQSHINMWDEGVTYILEKGVTIENASSHRQSIFGVVTSGGTCSIIGNGIVKETGSGGMDLLFDLGTAAGGSVFIELFETNCQGGGFFFRTSPRVDILVKTKMKNNNNIGEFLRTRTLNVQAETIHQNGGSRQAMTVDNGVTGGILSVKCKEYIVSGTVGCVFSYGGAGMTGDSIHVEFKADRFTINPGTIYATFLNGRGKIFARNSSGSGNNKFLSFEIGELNDRSGDTMSLFSTTGTASPNLMQAFVKIQKGYSNAPIYSSTIASNDIWRFDVKNWTNTSSSKAVFQNYAASTSGEWWISGRYTSNNAPVVRLSASRAIYINDAIFNCTNQTAITTNSEINLRNTVLLSGTSAPIANIVTAPVSANCLSVFSNSTVVDSDVNEMITPIVRNTNVK
jgi:hypothetical protein